MHKSFCIAKREGKAASTEPPARRQNANHIRIIVLFCAGILRPEIRPSSALSALVAVAGQGRQTTITVLSRNAKPDQHRQAQQSQSQCASHLRGGQRANRRAVGRGAGEAGRK